MPIYEYSNSGTAVADYHIEKVVEVSPSIANLKLQITDKSVIAELQNYRTAVAEQHFI